MPDHPPQIAVALTIAGSDPSGGAGIQADIKTFTVLGVYCGAAITALTTQNTLGVSSFKPLPPEFVVQQAREVLDDLRVTHIKIGMVGSAEIADALCAMLQDFQGEIVYDPVAGSSAGSPLIQDKNHAAIRRLAGQSTILTPNLAELAILSEQPCQDSKEALAAAGSLFAAYPRLKAICLKGGHIDPESETVTDFLLRPASGKEGEPGTPLITPARHPRIRSKNTHGTGCTFASAFTAFHMKTGDIKQAFSAASSFMDRLIARSAEQPIGHGTGPLLHHLLLP